MPQCVVDVLEEKWRRNCKISFEDGPQDKREAVPEELGQVG